MLRGIWALLRFIAVVSSSIATILSSLLPLYLYSSIATGYLSLMFVFLALAALTIHGVLTHSLNDYTDFNSGTDAYSPAILSGGSRVIQKRMIPLRSIWLLAKWLAIVLLIMAAVLAAFARYKLTILLLIGVWSAASYSLPPLRLSYRPFWGEWFCLFPAMLFLGLAGPWLIVGSMPLWALQNAVINAFICMAWVMIHHIPDLEADRKATPMKRTSVVWCVDKFGLSYARLPAMLYLFMAGLCIFWLSYDRFHAALFLLITISIALFLVMKIDVDNEQQVTNIEKALLLLAMIIAVGLGIFI